MIARVPPASAAAAPVPAPLALEEAFAAARAAADPAAVLASDAPAADKLAAIDALHSRVPGQARAAQAAALDALAGAASSPKQPPEVRAKALTFLGYVMPQVKDDAARTRGLKVLLAALASPDYRIFALRGLAPACHELPKADEPSYQAALLDLLDGPAAGEERGTAFVALYAFVSSRDDLPKRAPALVAQLDARLLAPIEADPAAFARDPRSTPASRELAAATFWISARQRQALGTPAPAARAHAVLTKLAELETDPAALAWLKTYRDAAPAKPGKGLRANTTNLAPAGPDAP